MTTIDHHAERDDYTENHHAERDSLKQMSTVANLSSGICSAAAISPCESYARKVGGISVFGAKPQLYVSPGRAAVLAAALAWVCNTHPIIGRETSALFNRRSNEAEINRDLFRAVPRRELHGNAGLSKGIYFRMRSSIYVPCSCACLPRFLLNRHLRMVYVYCV